MAPPPRTRRISADTVRNELLSVTSASLTDFSAKKSQGPRSIADTLESKCSELARKHFDCLYAPCRSARSLEDFTVSHATGKVYVDVKTHCVRSGGFSMPNLISIKKLRALLDDPSAWLVFLFVDYERTVLQGVKLLGVEARFVWELDWSMLRIGSLGLGQLQIKDANKKLTFTDIGREEWGVELKKRAKMFYESQLRRTSRELLKWS